MPVVKYPLDSPIIGEFAHIIAHRYSTSASLELLAEKLRPCKKPIVLDFATGAPEDEEFKSFKDRVLDTLAVLRNTGKEDLYCIIPGYADSSLLSFFNCSRKDYANLLFKLKQFSCKKFIAIYGSSLQQILDMYVDAGSYGDGIAITLSSCSQLDLKVTERFSQLKYRQLLFETLQISGELTSNLPIILAGLIDPFELELYVKQKLNLTSYLWGVQTIYPLTAAFVNIDFEDVYMQYSLQDHNDLMKALTKKSRADWEFEENGSGFLTEDMWILAEKNLNTMKERLIKIEEAN